MKLWLRLTVITLTVGGGFLGLVGTLHSILKPQTQQPVHFVLLAWFLVLYAFVLTSGLLLVHNPQRTLPLLIVFVLQVPWISSPLLAYHFTAGFRATLVFMSGRFDRGINLGSDWQFSLFQDLPWGVGVNVFALLIVILLSQPLLRGVRRK